MPALAQAEFARLHEGLAVLTKTVALLAEADQQKRKQAAWVAVREEDIHRLRIGPPIGFLVSGGLVMASGVTMIAANDELTQAGALVAAAGGLLAVTGVITLTRVVRKRRAIRREILRSLRPH